MDIGHESTDWVFMTDDRAPFGLGGTGTNKDKELSMLDSTG